MDTHLEGIIERQVYLSKKEQLINRKIKTQEKAKELSQGNNWLEPMREFILELKQTKKAAAGGNYMEIKTFLKKIGSNFILKDTKCEFLANFGWEIFAHETRFPIWSGRPVSNRRPSPWQGDVLPTELLPRNKINYK